ncbi:hypothetical protein ACIQLG_06790 [Terribacillus saccharophilus]|uniref:hypothetical protein n=1 Tax=Terribacillus saccharophilus TaxID=361277 RepID=UPI0038048F75
MSNIKLNYKLFFLGLAIAIVAGSATAFYPIQTLIGFGTVIYLALVWLLISEMVMKVLLPYFMVVILFQETIALQLGNLQDYFTYADELFILLYLPALIISFFKGKQIKLKSVLVLILCLIAIGFISALTSQVPISISFQGMLLMMKGLLYFFIFANINFNIKDLTKYKKWFKSIAIVLIIGTVIDLIFTEQFRSLIGNNHFTEYRIPGIVSVNSFFVHPGILGWFMVMLGLYYLAKIKMNEGYRNLIPLLILFGIAALTFRFKVVLSIGVVLLILYLLTNLKKSMLYFFPIAILTTCAYLMVGDYVVNLTELTIDRYLSVSVYDSARTALYYFGLEIAIDNFPLGVGFGRYGGFIARENYSPVYYEYGMHNIYGLMPSDPKWATDTYWPSILGELGFIGFILMAVALVIFMFKLLKGYRKMATNEYRVIVFFGGLVLLQALVESSGEAIFSNTPQSFFVFMIVGISYSLLRSKENKIDNCIKEEETSGSRTEQKLA